MEIHSIRNFSHRKTNKQIQLKHREEKRFFVFFSVKISNFIDKKQMKINKIDIDETNEMMMMMEIFSIDENKNNDDRIEKIHQEKRIDMELFSNRFDVR